MTGADGHDRPEGGDRTCLTCGEPVILVVLGGNPEPVDTLHAINIGTHDHDAVTGCAARESVAPPLTAELRMCFGICDHVDCLP